MRMGAFVPLLDADADVALCWSMRIAVVQLCSTTDPTENLRLMREALGSLGAERVDLAVFPEATMASFATRSAALAEPLDGPFAQGVDALAAEFDVTVAVGMFTPAGERCRNTCYVSGPDGRASYDKVHLFDAFGFRESDHLEPGERPVVIDVAGARVGLAICYDVRFPELFTWEARHGAAVIVLGASWQDGPGKVDAWRTLVTARALDSTTFVVACGQAKPEASGRPGGRGPLGVGHSLVVGPDGRVIAEAGDGPEVLVVDLDLDAVAAAREALPVLRNARWASGW